MDVLTDTQLAQRGWSIIALRAEIAAGRLQAKQQGTGFVVEGTELQRWMDTPQGKRVGELPRDAGAASGPARAGHHTAAAGSTGDAWQELCSRLVREGTPQTIAAAAADKAFPGGRLDLVEQTNRAATEESARHAAEVRERRTRLNAR